MIKEYTDKINKTFKDRVKLLENQIKDLEKSIIESKLRQSIYTCFLKAFVRKFTEFYIAGVYFSSEEESRILEIRIKPTENCKLSLIKRRVKEVSVANPPRKVSIDMYGSSIRIRLFF